MCNNIQKKLCTDKDCNVCFNRSFASSDKAKFWSDKNKLKPREVFKSSNKKFWFNCDNHEFESTLNSITAGRWCPYSCCVKPSRKLCLEENCKICFNASIASHEKAQFWSNKNKLKPREVFKSSHIKFWFNCDKSNHEFESNLANITKDRWCPYPCCNTSPKKLCSHEDCKICYNASFASHEKVKYWSAKNDLKPREVFKSSAKKYWFNCGSHEFETSLYNIVGGHWCPYPCCDIGGKKKLCSNENCEICFNASFAISDRAQFWHGELNINENEEFIKPRELCKSTRNKYWFKCENNHIFEMRLDTVTTGGWCLKCSKYGYSKKAIKWLTQIMTAENIHIQHAQNGGEYIIKTPIFKSSVDGYCKEINTVYEFHGDFWHGNPNKFNPADINLVNKVTFGKLYENTLQREQKIRDLGYNLIVIWESEYTY